MERKRGRPSLDGSYERVFHECGEPRLWIDLTGGGAARELDGLKLQRAIGVIHRPQTERWSHYIDARCRGNSI